MEIVSYIVIGLGGLVLVVGNVWFIIETFKTSILWGLGTLFIPFVSLVWLVLHWEDGMKPFLISLGGAIVMGGGIVLLVMTSGADRVNQIVNKAQQSNQPSKTVNKEPIDPDPLNPLNPDQIPVKKDPLNPLNPDQIPSGAKGLSGNNIANSSTPPANPLPTGPADMAQNTSTPPPAPENTGEILFAAIQSNDSVKAIFLLNHGTNPNIYNEAGATPLINAARKGNNSIVLVLLRNNAQVDTPNKFGVTPLIAATENGHIDIVKMLIEKGADVTIADIHGETPLAVAKSKNNNEIIDLLLHAGAKK